MLKARTLGKIKKAVRWLELNKKTITVKFITQSTHTATIWYTLKRGKTEIALPDPIKNIELGVQPE